MSIKQLLTKTLLVAAALLVGASAWGDPIETVGTLSSGWWADFSNTYTLESYGKYHFQFTTTNANDGKSYKTWLLVATDGNNSHGGGGTEYFVWRGDNYAWGQGKNSNPYNETENADGDPTRLVCSNTYATANPAGAGIQAAMNGAAVDMVITRESTNIYATATVTPTNGENEFTMSFSYLYGNATSANVGLFFTVQNAQVVLNTAEQTSKWTTVWNADFSSAPAGMTYSVTNGSTSITNGYLELAQSGNGDRGMNIAFTDTKFNVDTDWIMEFDWSCGLSNQNTSTGTFATDQGTAFIVSWGNNGTTATIKDASENTLTSILPPSGYNTSTMSKRARFTVKGVAGDGIYLTVSQEGTTYVNNVKVSSTFSYPKTFNGIVARAVSRMFLDNIVFKTPAVAGFVATPTSEITGAAGTSRKFTLSCLTDGATIYYATTDLEKGAAGWETYTGEVTTAAATIYAYAKKGDDTSDKMNFATGAGTTINLLPATVTHSNNGVYTIASDQSAILGAPTATIHYQIDGGSEQTSTNASVNVNIDTDGTLTYWLTADGYGATAPADETVYAPRAYATTTTLNFCTNSDAGSAAWAYGNVENYDMSTITVVTVNTDRTYYKYLDQSGNIIGDGLLAVSAVNGGSSWRIDKNSAGVHPYNKTEYVVLLGMEAGQLIQIAASSAPSSTSNLTAVPAATYTGTYTYTATADGEVIFSLAKNVVLKTIKLCETSVSKTITAAGYATYCSPYALDIANATPALKAYRAYKDGDLVKFAEVTEVPANEGILLKGAANDYTIPVLASADAITNVFEGVLSETTIPYDSESDAIYVLKNGTSGVGFYKTTKAFTVGANTAYLPASVAGGGGARQFIGFEDETTGIMSLNSALSKGEDAIFNLRGQRVAAPQKGLYIVNGKKVVIK